MPSSASHTPPSPPCRQPCGGSGLPHACCASPGGGGGTHTQPHARRQGSGSRVSRPGFKCQSSQGWGQGFGSRVQTPFKSSRRFTCGASTGQTTTEVNAAQSFTVGGRQILREVRLWACLPSPADLLCVAVSQTLQHHNSRAQEPGLTNQGSRTRAVLLHMPASPPTPSLTAEPSDPT